MTRIANVSTLFQLFRKLLRKVVSKDHEADINSRLRESAVEAMAT